LPPEQGPEKRVESPSTHSTVGYKGWVLYLKPRLRHFANLSTNVYSEVKSAKFVIGFLPPTLG